jgi:hypothetical protein
MTTVQAKITVNNTDINSILQPNQVLIYTVDPKVDNVMLLFKNQNFSIGSVNINQPQVISNKLRELKKDTKLSSLKGGKVELNTGAIATHAGAKIVGTEEILIKANIALGVTNTILRSPKAYLVANHFNLQACFLESADFLQLESVSKDALFRIIRFTFRKDSKFPDFAQGVISLDTGKIEDGLIVSGVSKVEILLHESAFKD